MNLDEESRLKKHECQPFFQNLKISTKKPLGKLVDARDRILDPRSQRAGSYKFGAVIVNV